MHKDDISNSEIRNHVTVFDVRMIGGSRPANYVLPSKTLMQLDWLKLMDGRNKADIVADCVMIAAILRKNLSCESLNMIRDQNLGPVFRDGVLKTSGNEK